MSAFVDGPPPQTASERAVLYLRMALVSGDLAKRDFFLGRMISALADAVGIEAVIAAIKIGAEYHSD